MSPQVSERPVSFIESEPSGVDPELNVPGNHMKSAKADFMRNPLSKVRLVPGLSMKDATGTLLGEADPVPRQSSRQLTIHEYANLKNSEGGL